MKNKFTTLTVLATIASLAVFYQCTNTDSLYEYNPIDNQYFEKLNDVHDSLASFTNDTIYFQWDDPTQDTMFTTPEGAEIFFPGASSSSGDNPCAGCPTPYTVSFIELYRRGDMVKHNVTSFWRDVNNKESTVSGGMLHLKMIDGSGQEITGVHGNIYSKIPNRTFAEGFYDEMMPFIGVGIGTPSGSLVGSYWENPVEGASVSYDPDEGQNGKYTLTHMMIGWNQPGADYTNPMNATQIYVKTSPVDEVYADTEVFFISKDHTAVIPLTQTEDGYIKTEDGVIPNGIGGSILGISVIDGQLYFGREQVVVTGNDFYELIMEQGTMEELLTMLNTFD